MANTASAKKRIRQNQRDWLRNRHNKSMVKSETRKFLQLLHQGDLQAAQDAFSRVQKKLDQVAAKGSLHRNTVARRKSRLARRLEAARASADAG